jgi:hypothetical protein
MLAQMTYLLLIVELGSMLARKGFICRGQRRERHITWGGLLYHLSCLSVGISSLKADQSSVVTESMRIGENAGI